MTEEDRRSGKGEGSSGRTRKTQTFLGRIGGSEPSLWCPRSGTRHVVGAKHRIPSRSSKYRDDVGEVSRLDVEGRSRKGRDDDGQSHFP